MTPAENVFYAHVQACREKYVLLPLIAVIGTTGILIGCSTGTPQSRAAAHMAKGKEYATKYDYRRAIIEFKVASQNMPKDAEPLYSLGTTYLRAGSTRQALETFQKAAEVNPKHEGVHFELAMFKVGSSKIELVEEAAREISTYLKLHPDDPEAPGSLALAEAKLGHRDDALRLLQSAIARKPTNTRPAAVIIAFYAAKGDIDTSREIVKSLTTALPDSPDVAVLRAEVSLATRDFDDADVHISRALSLNRTFQPALQLRLRRELMSGKTQDAEQTTKELSKLPQKRGWSAYARLLFAEKKIDEGIVEFDRVLKERNDDPELRDQYSALLIAADRKKEALAIIQGTLLKNQKDSAALLQRVTLLVDGGDLEAASKDVKTLLSMKLTSPLLSYQQARILAARGESLRQGDLLLEALKANPHFLRARLDLAQILMNAGKTKEALHSLEEAGEPENQTPEYAYFHNMALMADGRWQDARKGVDAVLAKVRSPAFLYQDAVLRSQNQDLPGCGSHWRRHSPWRLPIRGRSICGQRHAPTRRAREISGPAESRDGPKSWINYAPARTGGATGG